MKTFFAFFIFVLFTGVAQCQTQQISSGSISQSTPYSIVYRDGNSRVWQQTAYETLPSGQKISHVHQYTEMASGLCYQKGGQWLDSQEQINILPDGTAAATNGQHQVYFPGDIYNGVITLVTPGGIQMQSRPIGLSYDDGTNTILIAELTNSVGQLIGSNQVIYANAFVGISADLLYTYRKGGFEQDIILRQRPVSPEQCGLNSECSRLQLLTEFFDTPAPVENVSAVNPQDGLQDATLDFGTMKMVHGKAFMLATQSQKNNPNQIPVYKYWAIVNGRALLIEQVPYQRISAQMTALPLPSANSISSINSLPKRVSLERLLPPLRLTKNTTNAVQLVRANSSVKPGFVFDYVTIDPGQTNFIFQGDMTYYVSAEDWFYGTNILEGGTVIKYNGYLAVLNLDTKATLICPTAPYRPAVFTSFNDNSVGETISGSSGSPDMNDVSVFLNAGPTNMVFQNIRFCYSGQGVAEVYEPNFFAFRDCQFMNVGMAVYAYNVSLYNVLIGCSPSEYAELVSGGLQQIFLSGNLVAENVTADSGYGFVYANTPGEVFALTNCLVTHEPMTNGATVGATLWTNSVIYVPGTPSPPIYKIVGNANYYLADGSSYRAVGTRNIDSNLLADLSQKTTYPPMVCSNLSFSTPTNFYPYVSRDMGNYLDLGYHYDPLDYVFGGCAVSANLTFAAGTAVGWFQCSGPVDLSSQPYTLGLQDGASVSFVGNATQPCFFSSVPMVQEEGNGPWNTRSGDLGSIVFNGSGSTPLPSLYANFTKYTVQDGWGIFEDNDAHGTASFLNCEFYNTAASTYNMDSMYFTNCLFFRAANTFWYSPALSYINCTLYDGALGVYRNGSAVLWQFQNCAFDGTIIVWQDVYNGASNTAIDHNAYYTNNLSWQTYPYFYSFPPTTNKLEVLGSSDLMLTNSNWQTSWFGNFYLSTNSLLINKGSTNANLLGLYHFTTQANQIPETNSTVDIGYHYVATDTNGIPLDANGDGIPDYIEDANGNGQVDSGEIGWNILGDQGLSIIITQPPNGSTLP